VNAPLDKKILLLTNQLRTDNSGMRVYGESLEAAMKAAGFAVAYLTHHDCHPFVKRLLVLLIKAVRPLGRDFQQIAVQVFIYGGALDALRTYRPSDWLVLAQDPITGSAAVRRGFSVVVTCHASDFVAEQLAAQRFSAPARGLLRRLMHAFLSRCPRYVTLTSAQAAVIRRDCPNAAISVFPTICRIRPGLPLVPHAGFRVAMMGRLEALKGQERLIEALPLVTDASCEVWLVGAGADEPRLRERAAALGVAGRVRFCGHAARPDALLRECDLYVHTSRMEAMSLSPIEAVCAGLPAWCYETPGSDDFGLFDAMPRLPQETTARQLAAEIDRWIARGPAAARAAWSAQLEKAAVFSPERVAARYVDLITQIEETEK